VTPYQLVTEIAEPSEATLREICAQHLPELPAATLDALARRLKEVLTSARELQQAE
jgi:hypothetical protein